jgi:hypothetical protein
MPLRQEWHFGWPLQWRRKEGGILPRKDQRASDQRKRPRQPVDGLVQRRPEMRGIVFSVRVGTEEKYYRCAS